MMRRFNCFNLIYCLTTHATATHPDRPETPRDAATISLTDTDHAALKFDAAEDYVACTPFFALRRCVPDLKLAERSSTRAARATPFAMVGRHTASRRARKRKQDLAAQADVAFPGLPFDVAVSLVEKTRPRTSRCFAR